MADDKKDKVVSDEAKKKESDSKKAGGDDASAASAYQNRNQNRDKTEEKSTSSENQDKKDVLDELIDEGDLILQDRREPIPLTPDNAVFAQSKGGLISLKLKQDDGTEEFFERVVALRAFPISNPDEFISVREPDTKKKGKGHEIGIIRRLADFDEQTVRLIKDELERRYFTPVIKKIYSVKEKFGYSYWDSDTSAGRVTFILTNPFSNIRVLEDGRIFIYDIDGNTFEIPDPKKLDPASYRKIEIYL